MSQGVLLTIGLAAVFVGLSSTVVILAVTGRQRQQVARQLSSLASYGTRGLHVRADEQMAPLSDRLAKPLLAALSAAARRCSPGGSAAALSHRLDLAGNPAGWTLDRLYAVKGLLGLCVGIGAFAYYGGNLGSGLVGLLGGAAAGFFIPDLLLYNAGTKRQAEIQRALPDALDLLVISVEAGLGFDSALLNVTRKTSGPLSKDFSRVLQEMQIGSSRRDALKALAERSTVQELRGFVSALVQSDKLGIPVANVLREQAAEIRLKRQQRAEERAQKVPVKILFPLVLFIFPTLFIIVLGPAAISIIKLLGGGR